jgi:RNA polymerase sigma-70 factor (ECF subfamily)
MVEMARRSDDGACGLSWGGEATESSVGEARPVVAAAEHRLPLHDREQLGTLLTSLEPRLIGLALRITRHPESARDVVQNAFEKVIRHGARFQGQSRVSTWVHRIVANEALMWLRAQRRRAEVQASSETAEIAGLADASPGPAEWLHQHERVEQLHAGLRGLSHQERDVMLHCALEDESYADYGARAGVHPAAVKSRAFRARRHLGALLQQAPS